MNEKQVERLNELRQIAMSAPVILPMLEKRRKSAVQRLIAAYRINEELVGHAAEIAVIDEMEREVLRRCEELENIK